jgi:hypothetical protein
MQISGALTNGVFLGTLSVQLAYADSQAPESRASTAKWGSEKRVSMEADRSVVL